MTATPRHRPTRLVACAALCALAAAACSTDSGSGTATSSAPATAQPGATTRTTPAGAVPAEDPAQALAIAAGLVSQARAAAAQAGPDGDAARAAAYRGDALAAAQASARLDATLTDQRRSQLRENAEPPVVVAVSAGAAYPRTIVARTTSTSGKPVLYLLVAPDAQAGYRIEARVPMLRGGTVPGVQPGGVGSAWLGDGSGLAVTPSAFAARYAAALAFPTPDRDAEPPFLPDEFATATAADVAKQATGLGDKGTITQTHAPKAVLGGLRLDGSSGALAFVTMARTDNVAAASGTTLTHPAEVALLSGRSQSARVQLGWVEFVAVVLPAAGKASVVGAETQLVSAVGS